MEIKRYTWALINTIGLLAVLVFNYLANALPIAGRTTGELSDLYPNLFVPAGVTFSIWGIIYLFLILFVGNQWYSAYKGHAVIEKINEKVGLFFLLSCLANIGWIYTWHHQMLGVSILMMLILLGALLAIYVRINASAQIFKRSDKVMVLIPFSLYTSWITVALVANITAALVHIGWEGMELSEVFWTNLMIAAAFIISMSMTFRYGDIFFGGVTIWALLGIIVKRSASAIPDTGTVVLMSWIGIAAVASIIAVVMYKKRLYNKHKGLTTS